MTTMTAVNATANTCSQESKRLLCGGAATRGRHLDGRACFQGFHLEPYTYPRCGYTVSGCSHRFGQFKTWRQYPAHGYKEVAGGELLFIAAVARGGLWECCGHVCDCGSLLRFERRRL